MVIIQLITGRDLPCNNLTTCSHAPPGLPADILTPPKKYGVVRIIPIDAAFLPSII